MVKPEDVVKLLAMDCAYEHAEAVQRLIQQRAELLEALKDSLVVIAGISCNKEQDILRIKAAITKAEAAE